MPQSRPGSRTPSLRPIRQRSNGRRVLTGVLVAIVVVLALLIQLYDEYGAEPAPTPATALAGDAVQVYFTTPALIYPDVVDQRVNPPHLTALLEDIAAAEQSVDVAVFEYNLLTIADTLVDAVNRGVTVRLALDRESLEDPDDARFAGLLEDAGATISWQDGDGFLHSKFVIIDERIVWTGSWNMTGNDTFRNNNNLLRFVVPELVADYATEFSEMLAGRFGNDKAAESPYGRVTFDGAEVHVFFTPRERPRAELVTLLSSAQQEILFLAFSFTSDEIGAALVERAAAGVNVSGVIEKRNANGLGSELETLLNGAVDVLTDGNCYTMHHKVMIIDQRYVVTGSYNFTQRAETVNDENLLIIDSAALASAYLDEYERVRGQAENPLRCGS